MISDAFNWWCLRASPQGKVLVSIILIAVFVLLRMLVLSLIHQRVTDTTVAYIWRRRTTSLVTVLVIVLLAWLWSDTFHSVATLLGLVAAALVLALKDLVANMAGWLLIHSRRLFRVGDRIEVSGHAGDVIDIRLFEFTLIEVGNWVDADQSSGRLIHVPNGKVLTEPLANYTKDFNYIWNELSVVITFESKWQKVKSILEEIATRVLADTSQDARRQLKKAAQRYMIFFRNLTPIVYIKVQDNGVRLTIRYLTRPRERRTTEHQLWEEILSRFAEHDDIELAYPTVRYYSRGEIERQAPRRGDSSSEDGQGSGKRGKAQS
ncbi:MAG TPA: mechanosensitive ion channel domain-containing protein [bacterium]|nr:mechanosensitive ion channel domain-containing protein [bacterium]